MTPESWPRVSDLMHRALAVPEPERRAWIEAEAGGDAALAAEVVRLLDAHGSAGRFLDEPLLARPGMAAVVHDALPPDERQTLAAGTLAGHYRVLREIGRGGMGAVYLGARADDAFQKQVAIKIAPGALVSGALGERFARERQLLATLDHPGIARILDAGATESGLPYLVMEYVNGVRIDEYCQVRRLGLEPRLRLVAEVCRAVQYAHDRLVVHRDIKASNVLVDEDGQPKLLDFGIAKLLEPDGARSEVTLVQAWTPESASPEQVRGEATTIATDVYGLGALVYRLLTGRPVFDLGGLTTLERTRVICDVVPDRPSAVTASTEGGVEGAEIRRDLDLIVLKALAKDPARRYRSAEHLAEDLERHLARRPVLAAPDSRTYRVRKFVERHPAATLASTVAVIAVVAATGTALWQARRAEQERDRAEARLADVRRLANTLIFDVYDRVENSTNATPIRRALVEKGLQYLDQFTADAASDPALSLELAEAYRRLAAVQGARGGANLGDREGALKSLEKGRALLQRLRDGGDVSLAVDLADLGLLRELASLLMPQPERARPLAAEGVERSNRLWDRHPDRIDVIEARAHAYFFAALAAPAGETLQPWTEANRVYAQLIARRPDDATHLRNLALTEKYIGTVHQVDGRLDLARANYERALELDRRVQQLRPTSRQTVVDLAIDLGNVAGVLRQSTPPDLKQAADLYRESLALRERAAAEDPQDVFSRQAVGFGLMQLSDVTRQLGQFEAAIAYGRRAVEVYESLAPNEFLARRGYAWHSSAWPRSRPAIGPTGAPPSGVRARPTPRRWQGRPASGRC
jgi:non-specific serine/threonine protein kinase/serine/threonine-protein kinase